MSEPTENPEEKIRALEAEVLELRRRLDAVQAERRSSASQGRRIGDPIPKPPPALERVWVIRALMILATLAIGAATAAQYGGPPNDDRTVPILPTDYVLIVCGLAALLGVAMHRRRTLGFLFLVMMAVYPAFTLYLLRPPVWYDGSPGRYGFLAFSLLTLWHVLIAVLCVMESRRLGRGRRRSALLATVNSLAFYPIAVYGLAVYGDAPRGAIYLALGAIALALAVYAESSGAHRNYLVQVFLISAIGLANLMLNEIVDGPLFVAALSMECLVLAVLHYATGIVVLKAVNLLVLLAAFILSVQAMKFTGPMYIGSQAIQSNWVQGAFTSFVLFLTSLHYARHVRSVRPHHRRHSGQWFLADTAFDVPASTASLLHAAGASLLLMLLVISDLGDSPALPFILAVFSAFIAVAGVLLRTPQIEIAAVMLVVAAHVSFYFFLYTGKVGFSDQPYFAVFTLLLAAYTFIGGYRAERFLARVGGGHTSEHAAAAAVPYVIATGSAGVVVYQYTGLAYAPVAMTALAVALAGAGAALHANGLKLSAATALGVAAGVWGYALVRRDAELLESWALWPMLAAFVAGCIGVERSFTVRRHGELLPGAIEHIAQVGLLLAAASVVAVTIDVTLPARAATAALLAHAGLWIAACFFVRATQYRWTALLLLAATTGWLMYRQQRDHPESGVGFLVAAAVLLFIVLCGVWYVTRGPFGRAPLAHGK